MDEAMDEMFDEVLAICLDRLSDGDDVASCAADYPECPDLQPLLELTAALSSVSGDVHRRVARAHLAAASSAGGAAPIDRLADRR